MAAHVAKSACEYSTPLSAADRECLLARGARSSQRVEATWGCRPASSSIDTLPRMFETTIGKRLACPSSASVGVHALIAYT
ncbi:hypothetical protein [Burkholderia oklahomensis]|uniref:hypothetical protein n=1 Tax=Burkholderia oklahomensis TaxID=342113 RepID=UPI00265A77E6|nr:hypothetical protein [Burkholderia oklahomensis]